MNECTANIAAVALRTEEGYTIIVPAHELERAKADGRTVLRLRVASEAEKPWPTIKEAAVAHLDDVDGLTFDASRMKISRAIAAGKINARGRGIERRIDPDSLAAWRLSERERNLAKVEVRQ